MTTSSSLSQPDLVWRRIAILGWALIALAFLAYFLLDLRLDYIQLLLPARVRNVIGWPFLRLRQDSTFLGLSHAYLCRFYDRASVVIVAVYGFWVGCSFGARGPLGSDCPFLW